MPDRAQVTSVEAIESFRSALIIYMSKARPALEEMSGEVQRARQWLQHDQRRHWENEARARGKKLESAKAELFNVTLSRMQDSSSLQQLMVHRAEAAFKEVQEKMTMLKKWDHELDNRSEPLVKQVDQFQNFMTTEMPRAIAYLGQVIKTLEAYADVALGGLRDIGATTKIEDPSADVPPAADSEKPKA
jgi:hypothetical protein